MAVTSDCLFCRIVAGEIPATVVHETETTPAFRDIRPRAAAVHGLVIPKSRHADVAALATANPRLAGAVLATCADVAKAEGLTGSTGADGGQEVFHAHAHVLGGQRMGPMVRA
ncbi:HIT domain-containing protein [Dactylosporangium sp. CA-233914]|uniref:HIT domain-containing protein n=1 Tax=Dactylosporangium sp. CA-233914 TaxID=3239934 RepID=UPI003D8B21DC